MDIIATKKDLIEWVQGLEDEELIADLISFKRRYEKRLNEKE